MLKIILLGVMIFSDLSYAQLIEYEKEEHVLEMSKSNTLWTKLIFQLEIASFKHKTVKKEIGNAKFYKEFSKKYPWIDFDKGNKK